MIGNGHSQVRAFIYAFRARKYLPLPVGSDGKPAAKAKLGDRGPRMSLRGKSSRKRHLFTEASERFPKLIGGIARSSILDPRFESRIAQFV